VNGRRYYQDPAASAADALAFARSFARQARRAVGQRRAQLLAAARVCLAEAIELRDGAA
jgi:hypothetical protein